MTFDFIRHDRPVRRAGHLLVTGRGGTSRGRRRITLGLLAAGFGLYALASWAEPKFGFTPFPYDYTPESESRTNTLVVQNSNIYALHFDQCVPWKQMLANRPMPPDWARNWRRMAAQIPSDHTMYLALTPTGTDRETLAPGCADKEGETTSVPGEIRNAPFDDPRVMHAFTNYARAAIRRFKPDYINLGIEIDGLARSGRKWRQFSELFDHARTALKREFPNLRVGVSFTLQSLLAPRIHRRVKGLVEKSDYLGLSFYPYGSPFGEKFGYPSLGNPPDSWRKPLAWVRSYTTRPIAITETGYTTRNIELSDYGLKMTGNEALQKAYVHELVRIAKRDHYLFVIWFLAIDYDKLYGKMPDVPGKDVNLLWRNIGLLDGNLRPKPAWKEWQAFRNIRSVTQAPPLAVEGETAVDSMRPSSSYVLGFRSTGDVFHCGGGGQATIDPDAARRSGEVAMRWTFEYRGGWQWCQRALSAGVAAGASRVRFWAKSDTDGAIAVGLKERGGEGFFTLVEPGDDWEEFDIALSRFGVDGENAQDGKLDAAAISEMTIADGAGADGATGTRRIWISPIEFLGAAREGSAGVAPPLAPPADRPSGAAGPRARAAIRFTDEGSLFKCGPNGGASLERGDTPGAGVSAMRWHFEYTHDWQWCLKEVQRGLASGASSISFWVKSDTEDDVILSIDEDGEGHFSMISVGTAWRKVELPFDRFSVDEEKRKDGRLDPANIDQILFADGAGRDGATGARAIWISDIYFR